jgi:hypothetical protein
MIEVRGVGILHMPHEPLAVVGTLVELGQADVQRLPEPTAEQVTIEGITLPRLLVAASSDPLPPVLAYLTAHHGTGESNRSNA